MPMMVKSKKLVKFFGAKDEDDYFKLDENFIQSYKGKKANFGFNGLGEFVYYRTYSRIKSDGQKETFLDTCRRVVEGCFEIQRRHQRRLHLPWDHNKAQPTAQEMFNLMWEFKFLPPGRGLWMMGTDFMWERGSAALQNCGYISTNDKIEADPAEPFCFLMDMSMLGVGVGFDTKGANRICINRPKSSVKLYKVADSREGWVDSLRQLIHSYTINSDNTIEFDYSDIRPAGVSINGFGGKASGPDILVKLHEMSRGLLDSRIGKVLSSVDIVDLMNFIGSCVVAGNVRRSSELVLGDPNDSDYCNMKNVTATLADSDKSKFFEVTGKLYANGSSLAAPEDFNNSGIPQDRLFPAIKTWNDLNSHRWASNNSVLATVGMNYDHIGSRIAVNGEPGLVWLDNIRDYGRTIDGRQPGIDGRVTGTNPCLSGQMKLLTEKGYVSLYDLWVAGGKKEFCGVDNIESKYGTQNIVGLNGVVRASNVYRTSTNSPLFRVSLDDGSFIDATYSHTFIVDGVRKPLSELVVGDRIPKSPYFYVKIAGSDTSRIISLTSIPNDQTFCLTEPQSNQIIINGHVIGQCAEQSLESSELCCLCESFPANHDSAEDYMRTLKFAYLYAKTVTLYPTHNPRTNQVTLRNRRIGLSQSGIVQAFAKFGRRRFLNDFCNAGYTEIRRWDDIYSEWLCVNKSIKVTSVKPSGSVSLLAGSTPGIHYPEASTYWRRVRISNDSVLVNIMRNAGYHVEPSLTDSKTSIIKFAVSDERVRSVKDVSIWEQVKNLVDMQRIWSDNQVSCTIKFKRDEAGDIAKILEMYEDQLKSISFLPLDDHGYAQPPYEPCSPDDVANYNASLTDADYSDYITEAVGERYCTNDSCELAHK